jgi:hypothetical protein
MASSEELTFVQKRFLVQRLACFDTPTVAAKAFKEEFGIEVKPNRVWYYNPTTKFGAALADDLKAVFEKTRKEFLADLDSIPITHKAVRLRHLNRQLQHFSDRNAAPVVLGILEATAKEVGGVFTNEQKHEHAGKDGKELPAPVAAVTIIQLR